MTGNNSIDQTLSTARVRLADAGFDTPALDARLLLQHVTGLSHARLISDGALPVSSETRARFEAVLRQRLAGKSVHRIMGQREFFGHTFAISRHTLEPRADTETLIEKITRDFPDSNQPLRFVDIGTGTGAIAIALLKHYPKAHALAVDICQSALQTACHNAETLGVDRRFMPIQSNYLDSIQGDFDFLVSNPPYIRSAEMEQLPVDVREFDPRIALDGGADGLDAYRAILSAAKAKCANLQRIYFEIGHDQSAPLAQLAPNHGWSVKHQTRDLKNKIRVLTLVPMEVC